MYNYFAYGSNLGTASLLGKGIRPAKSFVSYLQGMSVCFRRPAGWRGVLGVLATLSHEDRNLVIGVVHQISAKDLRRLDWWEGVPFGVYERKEMTVYAQESKPFPAFVYIQKRPGQPGWTSRRYRGKMRVGAREFGMESQIEWYFRQVGEHS